MTYYAEQSCTAGRNAFFTGMNPLRTGMIPPQLPGSPTYLKPGTAVAHLERTKIYPLNGEATAKPMKFPDASGVPVNMLPISDGTVFEHLKRLLDTEGDDLASPDWLGMLATIGIVKDQPFAPDAHAREILDQAAKAAYKMSRVIGFEQVVGGHLLSRSIPTVIGPIPWPTGRRRSHTVIEPIVDEYGRRLSRARLPDQLLHQLLFGQPRHGLVHPRPGRQLYDGLHRREGHLVRR